MADGDLSKAKWFKSSRSEGGAKCVEVAWLAEGEVGVRDSKNPSGPALIFAPGEWDAFTAAVQDGGFQHPSA
ncbi:hypothetical protein BJY24_006845 [Nocardia transvalensis]|uniref:DUF397 domain-containing protein n=1 Tax=Nocardia transvalensis TaxID=37333 RepID=A0A7W9PLZ0_9NOCA|nr:DUF397 domain-containing protein [Nocardia transvalensis]MBB5917933.1 hypothetical protein [Nocardia transvalensis]